VTRRCSHQTKLILQTFLDAPTDEMYGLQVVRASGVAVGSAYAILRRLEDERMLTGRWEALDPKSAGRPPRRYYQLTDEGRKVARRETAQDRTALRLLRPGWSSATSAC
jgi:PadR family transcriptional regulator, regulatory protein PadR